MATHDVTIWEGDIGEWKEWQVITPADTVFACGAELQVEDYVGVLSDDTAANGLRLVLCQKDNWNEQTILQVFQGRWGSWRGSIMCPENHFIDGAQVQYEDFIGSIDGTGINGLQIHCSDGNNNGTWLDVHTGRFGSYRDVVQVSGGRVIGAAVRYQDPCGTTCDDTALNGIQFRFQGGELVDSSTASPDPAPILRGTPTIAPTRSPISTQSSNSNMIVGAVSSTVVVLIFLFVVLFGVCLYKRKKNEKGAATDNEDTVQPTDDTELALSNVPCELLNANGANPPILVEMNHAVAESAAKPDYKDQVRNVPLATAVAVDTNQL